MASITFEHIHKRYPGGVHAVKGVDLHIPDRAFVTLVGPSGCGKSTLLNLVAGLEDVTEGRLLFDDDEVNEWAPRERDVAMVFQSYALYPHKTAYENIAFPLRIAKFPKSEIDARVKEAARLLGIEALLPRRPKDMSGGQRQRVALGRALVRRPRVFLFDEPLSNLDAGLRVQMRGELKRLHSELKRTFLYVTHDQAEAMTLSDLVVVFDTGEIQQVGPPREVYARPANVFVARFLGSPVISLFAMTADGHRLSSQAGTLVRSPASAASPPPRGEVLVGVRAENASLTMDDGEGVLRGRIHVIEPMGAESFVTISLEGGGRLTCRAAPDYTAAFGEVVHVRVDPGHLHLFDPATERRLD